MMHDNGGNADNGSARNYDDGGDGLMVIGCLC